jgi:hypothetical protein
MKKVLYVFFLFFANSKNFAQLNNHRDFFSHDIGVFLGSAYYIGDINPRNHFNGNTPALGLFYRFNYSPRFSFRGGLNACNVSADDSQSTNSDQLERNLNFKSNIYECYAVSEFNFVEYLIGSKKFIFSPYVFLGINLFHFNPMGNIAGGSWVELRRLSTEGQKTTQNPNQKPYKLTQLGMPFGIGFKLNVANRLALGLEWSPRKTFTDYLDDVSGKYVDPDQLAKEKGSTSGIMSNRSFTKEGLINNTGKLRGNPNTKDWYFYYGVTLSIVLKQKPKECRGAQ